MTMNIPALPLSRKDSDAAIKTILEARKTVKVEAPVVKITAQEVQKVQEVQQEAPKANLKITAQSLTEAPQKGELVTPPAETPDEDVTAFLQEALPQLVDFAQQLFKPPFSIGRALTLAPKLMQLVSFIVATGLPAIKGLEAKALVVVLFRWLFRAYVAPYLGAFAGMLEPLILKGLEAAYQAVVKKQAKKFLADPHTESPVQFFAASFAV